MSDPWSEDSEQSTEGRVFLRLVSSLSLPQLTLRLRFGSRPSGPSSLPTA